MTYQKVLSALKADPDIVTMAESFAARRMVHPAQLRKEEGAMSPKAARFYSPEVFDQGVEMFYKLMVLEAARELALEEVGS